LPPQDPLLPRTDTKRHHVRWRDANDEFDLPRSAPLSPTGETWVSRGETGRERWQGYEYGSGEEKKGKLVGPSRGVGGRRRYAKDGMNGR
jgi:hypothetical protein